MHLRICIQDPTYIGTTYLYEAILAAAEKALDWRGLYAFASRDGVNHLIEDKVIHDLMNRQGRIELIVGIDAVTNRATLERMQELENLHDNFHPTVFWNETRGLFHPKLSDFNLADGGRIVIVGSGNLTPGGLMGNFEAYTIITAEQGEKIDISAIEEFLNRHLVEIRRIDDEVLERAANNIIRPIAGRRRGEVRVRRQAARANNLDRPAADPAPNFNRILLAQVPKAGGRWAQVHFNAQVIRDYFRLNRLDVERVYLTSVSTDFTRGEVEVRPCIFSADSNRNHKIEIGAAGHREYPPDDENGNPRPPLLIFRERQLRTFDYMLLLPNNVAYDDVKELSNNLPSPGRGLPRPITDMATLYDVWNNCPLLQDAEEEVQDL